MRGRVSLPLRITEQAGSDNRYNDVENYTVKSASGGLREQARRHTEEAEQYPHISPPVPIVDIQRRVELVADLVLAIPTVACRIRVV